jgi:hypothetical protein
MDHVKRDLELGGIYQPVPDFVLLYAKWFAVIAEGLITC